MHVELSTLDKRALIRKGWEFNIKQATVGVSAEARLNLVEDAAAGGYSHPSTPHLPNTICATA
jgi:hypothetical protein